MRNSRSILANCIRIESINSTIGDLFPLSSMVFNPILFEKMDGNF
jgi:hypothetical protein